jgi:predicted phosphoadenosine phosphosulfate sulfurtransferase
VRCEESPSRRRGLTSYLTYKDITWGNASGKRWNQYTFYPLYDWRYSDIWKAIHVHGWPYCALYDYYYQYGIPVTKMRVSNVHHETALDSLLFMQELEPDTWEQVTARVQDVNTVTQARAAYRVPETLPWMFPSWETYRDYLLDHVITDAAIRARFVALFAQWDRLFVPSLRETVTKAEIAALLVNDYHGTKYDTFRAAHGRDLLSYQERRTA